MAWSAPNTASAGAFNAADFNTYVRDNLLTLAPALATSPAVGKGNIFTTTAANALVQRTVDSHTIATGETTTSTTYADLATVGPTVTATTGTRALVFIYMHASHGTAGGRAIAAVDVSGSTTVAASDNWALEQGCNTAANSVSAGICHLFTSLNAGSNTFTVKYRTAAGTATYSDRQMIVFPL